MAEKDVISKDSEVLEALSKINKKLEILIELNSRLLRINELTMDKAVSRNATSENLSLVPDSLTLLSLPTALRKTIMVLYKVERATANDLAKETKRLRAVESAAANRLVEMGYVQKRRVGRDVYFYISEESHS